MDDNIVNNVARDIVRAGLAGVEDSDNIYDELCLFIDVDHRRSPLLASWPIGFGNLVTADELFELGYQSASHWASGLLARMTCSELRALVTTFSEVVRIESFYSSVVYGDAYGSDLLAILNSRIVWLVSYLNQPNVDVDVLGVCVQLLDRPLDDRDFRRILVTEHVGKVERAGWIRSMIAQCKDVKHIPAISLSVLSDNLSRLTTWRGD